MIECSNLLENPNVSVCAQKGAYSVLEYKREPSVAPGNAIAEYYMAQMNVRKRQVLCSLGGGNGVVTQAGAMQWTTGSVSATTGVKGVGDLFGKLVQGSVTKESAIKPEYVGTGLLMLEPTYKYILLEDVAEWPDGMVVEDGMFLACDASVRREISMRKSLSSAVLGNEGLFNLALAGQGVAVLESNVPQSELICFDLKEDVLKIDGSMAIAWSGSLRFTVERSGRTLVGSAASGEGLVNVYRGTGRVLMCPTSATSSLFAASH